MKTLNDIRISEIENSILDLASNGSLSNERLATLASPDDSHLVSAALHNLLAQRAVTRTTDGSIIAA